LIEEKYLEDQKQKNKIIFFDPINACIENWKKTRWESLFCVLFKQNQAWTYAKNKSLFSTHKYQ